MHYLTEQNTDTTKHRCDNLSYSLIIRKMENNERIFNELVSEYKLLKNIWTPETIKSTHNAIMTLLDYEICWRIVSSNPSV